jgi:pilus assembly protein CpaC
MRAGHTLALAGHYREKNSNNTRGVPKLMDKPAIGTMFRRVQDEFNESELLFLITPNYIGEVEAAAMSQVLPGQTSQSPSDRELFLNAHSEVPRCQDDCPVNRNFGPQPIPTPLGAPRNGMEEQGIGDQAPGMGLRTSQPQGNREASQSNGFNWPANRR